MFPCVRACVRACVGARVRVDFSNCDSFLLDLFIFLPIPLEIIHSSTIRAGFMYARPVKIT